MSVYYNEWEAYPAQWLRNLIKARLLPAGDVDERDIKDVSADDLKGFTQCHFFAGIGGWPLALQMAGWPDDRSVWTGSCPCQPFSTAGKQRGHSDERHLWPYWFRLIGERRPAKIFGEQVAGAVAFGWLDEVSNDLEAKDYSIASAVLPACAVNAPHKRDRLWFVAQPAGCNDRRGPGKICQTHGRQEQHLLSEPCSSSKAPKVLAYANSCRLQGKQQRCDDEEEREEQNCRSTGLRNGRGEYSQWEIEPSVGRVAHGIPARMGAIKALGNAIVPQVAAEFIKAAEGCRP